VFYSFEDLIGLDLYQIIAFMQIGKKVNFIFVS